MKEKWSLVDLLLIPAGVCGLLAYGLQDFFEIDIGRDLLMMYIPYAITISIMKYPKRK
jgi:hypothetical protein